MRKEELRRLKRINATPEMVRMAENNKQHMEYQKRWNRDLWETKETRFDLMVRCQTIGRYLMICVFLPERLAKGELTPTYEIYCNPEDSQHITRILNKGREQRWSTAMVDNIRQLERAIMERQWNWEIEGRIWQNPEEQDEIKHVLKTSDKGIWGLAEWQHGIRERRIREAEKREQAAWDADMELVPEIFPSFDKWMKREASPEHFIFYKYQKKGTDSGFCSRCRKTVPVTRPRHNAEGTCKNCGAAIKYKEVGKFKVLTTSEYAGQCIQKIRGGIVVRKFRQRQAYYMPDFMHPKSWLHETERVLIMEDGNYRIYKWENYKYKKYRFVIEKGCMTRESVGCSYAAYEGKLYTGNLTRLKRTALKHSAIDLWDRLPGSVSKYLVRERENPAVEKLARIGMFRLAADMVKDKGTDTHMIDKNTTELAKMLRIDGQRLKRLKRMDGGICHLKWFQHEKYVDRIWSDEMIREFGNNKFRIHEFNFLPASLSVVKIWNYLKRQQSIHGGRRLSSVKETWKDYLNMAEKVGRDTGIDMVLRPKDLIAAHNELVMILQQGEIEKEVKKLEKKWRKVNSQLPKLQKYEYTDGKFSIITPKGIADIVKEGRILQHCVHTCDFYFDRIERDESYLFFLRRAEHEDVPWYTLEVEPNGNIRQKRTTGDNQNKDFEEAVQFLKRWQKEFVKRMSREEKELGIKADRARIEEYSKLRAEGNRVWHGKLAGQLLADVLEGDFMAAVL